MAKTPKYRFWRTRNQGFADGPGGRVYFPGEYNSQESLDAYNEWLAVLEAQRGETIAGLAQAYLDHVARVHGAGSRSTGADIALGIRELSTGHWGEQTIAEFGPRSLTEFQESLIRRGLARETVNKRVGHVRGMFRWAVSLEIVPPDQLVGLSTVRDITTKDKRVKKSVPRRPVPWEDVEPVFEALSPDLRAALWLQWYTGARSGTIVRARPREFERDAGSGLLLWTPERHKTDWKKTLVIPIGPQCEAKIAKCLRRRKDAPMFSPRRARNNGKAGREYSPWSYRRAIVRAQERAAEWAKERGQRVPSPWTPHQLRHARAAIVRSRYGLEASQAALGHDSIRSSQIYSARLLELAKTVAIEIG